MNTLTILVLAVLLLWWYKPLRVFLIQRTNRTVKDLLIVLPLLYVGRLLWRFYSGDQDDVDVVTITVGALLVAWVFLVWLTSWLERRRTTKVQAPDLAALARLPGMPRVPGGTKQVQQLIESPEVRQAARAAASAAARVDWDNVAVGVGRGSGRLFAKLKKGLSAGGQSGTKRPAPPPA